MIVKCLCLVVDELLSCLCLYIVGLSLKYVVQEMQTFVPFASGKKNNTTEEKAEAERFQKHAIRIRLMH